MNSNIEVKIEALPDTETKKFILPFSISKDTVEYPNVTKAQRSPLANKIFGFPWTEAVIVGPQFVIVKKQNWVDWEILAEPLAGLISEHFLMLKDEGQENFEENPLVPAARPKEALSKDPLTAQIQQILEKDINPMIAHHGGSISLVDATEDTVYVKLEGGCQGCASSKATVQQGVELAIKRALPQIQNVIDITDHAAGENPYMR